MKKEINKESIKNKQDEKERTQELDGNDLQFPLTHLMVNEHPFVAVKLIFWFE